MALTAILEPDDISSAYRPIIFRLTSDNEAPELILKTLIYCRNKKTDWQVLSSQKTCYRTPGQEYFEVDVSGSVQPYLRFDRSDPSSTLAIERPTDNSVVWYYCEMYEMIYDVNGVLTEADDYISNDLLAVNSVLQINEEDLADYIIPTTNPESVATKFLTDSPANAKIRLNEQAELHFLCESVSIELFACIRYYDAGTNNLYENNTIGVTVTANRGILVFKAIDPGEEVAWENVDRILVWLYDSEGDVMSIVTEVKTFKVDHKTRGDLVRIGWLNRLGGIDRYTFYGDQKYEVSVEKSRVRYQSRFQARTLSNETGRGTAVIFSEGQYDYEVCSDFHTSDILQWLMGILTSPEVWIEGTGTAIPNTTPIDVMTKKHVYKDNTLVQFKLGFSAANPIIVQNG